MKRFVRFLCAILAISLLCAVPSFASGNAPEDPSVFDVNIIVNGSEYATAPVSASVDVNVYTFDIEELLDAFGFELDYDEETNTASLSAQDGTIASVLFYEMQGTKAAESETAAEAAPAGTADEEPPAVGSKNTAAAMAITKNVPNARPAAYEKVREAPERKLPSAMPDGYKKPVRDNAERKVPNAIPAAMEKQYRHDASNAVTVRSTDVRMLPSAIPSIRRMLTYG